MNNQILNTKSIVFLCVMVLLSYGTVDISYGVCQVGDVLNPGESCQISTGGLFVVHADGSAQHQSFGFGGLLFIATDRSHERVEVGEFVATRQADGTWLIESVPVILTQVLVVDRNSPPIYWTDVLTEKIQIQRANLDGSNVEDLITGLESPRGIALGIPSEAVPPVDTAETKTRNADVNADGTVNIQDLVIVANAFGKAEPDLNGDGVVNIQDLVIVANAF